MREIHIIFDTNTYTKIWHELHILYGISTCKGMHTSRNNTIYTSRNEMIICIFWAQYDPSTACCIFSSISNVNRWCSSLGLFWHVPLERDQLEWDWRLRWDDTPNEIGCIYTKIWDDTPNAIVCTCIKIWEEIHNLHGISTCKGTYTHRNNMIYTSRNEMIACIFWALLSVQCSCNLDLKHLYVSGQKH